MFHGPKIRTGAIDGLAEKVCMRTTAVSCDPSYATDCDVLLGTLNASKKVEPEEIDSLVDGICERHDSCYDNPDYQRSCALLKKVVDEAMTP